MSRDMLRYVSFGNLSFAIMSSTLHSCKLKEQLPHIRAPLVERRILTLHTVQLILQCSNINDWSTPYICQQVLLYKKKQLRCELLEEYTSVPPLTLLQDV